MYIINYIKNTHEYVCVYHTRESFIHQHFLNSNSYIIISELEAFMRSYILSSECGAGMGWGIEVGKAMKSIESMEAGA